MADFFADSVEKVDMLAPYFIRLGEMAGKFYVPPLPDIIACVASWNIVPTPLEMADIGPTSIESLIQTIDPNFGLCIPSGDRPIFIFQSSKG
jgi:hypothetical protein